MNVRSLLKTKNMKKTILITGTSSGIGKAAVKLFSEKGWNVAATMRNPANEKELGSLPGVQLFALDVTSEKSIAETVAAVKNAFGTIDALVNNAGYGLAGPFEEASIEKIERVFATNVFGLMSMTRAVLPLMREQKDGVIVNITSIGGLAGLPMNSIYHATKFAVDGFSEGLFYELEPFNIRIKVVAPGGVATDFASRSLVLTTDTPAEGPYAETLGKVLTGFASRRGNYLQPEAVAAIIEEAINDKSARLRYLAGDDAKQILEARRQMPDEKYFALVKSNFNL